MHEGARAKRDRVFHAASCGPQVMGILNLTPDSFSDGGRYQEPGAALAHAAAMANAGATIIDIGAESTRPEAIPVEADEEVRRLEPILGKLIEAIPVAVSIDTSKASVARLALERGAVMVNDVWGLQRDPAMARTVAQADAGIVVMHNRSEMIEDLEILADMRAFFDRSLAIARDAGIPRERIMLDPGIGFGKTAQQNLTAVASVGSLRTHYGLPILVGVSRKKFLRGIVAGGAEGSPSGTLAVNLAAAAAGACMFRVHDVAEHVAALIVFETIRRAA